MLYGMDHLGLGAENANNANGDAPPQIYPESTPENVDPMTATDRLAIELGRVAAFEREQAKAQRNKMLAVILGGALVLGGLWAWRSRRR